MKVITFFYRKFFIQILTEIVRYLKKICTVTDSKKGDKLCTERLFVRVNDKDESKFSIISFQNGESRGFIRLIHIMTSKFDIVITVFNT